MNIGETIKKLRRNHDMTQEQLAEHLGISAQAVSRWETGLALPDIALLPAIANLFDVTMDELFGMEEIRSQERRGDMFRRAHVLIAENRFAEAAGLYREALKTFPRDDGILSDLALVLSLGDLATDEGACDAREAITLSERVLQSSTSDKIRGTTRVNLCYLLHSLGDRVRAREEGRKLPHFWESREMTLPELLEPQEAEAYWKENIRLILSMLCEKIDAVTNGTVGMKRLTVLGPAPLTGEEKDMSKKLKKIGEYLAADE